MARLSPEIIGSFLAHKYAAERPWGRPEGVELLAAPLGVASGASLMHALASTGMSPMGLRLVPPALLFAAALAARKARSENERIRMERWLLGKSKRRVGHGGL